MVQNDSEIARRGAEVAEERIFSLRKYSELGVLGVSVVNIPSHKTGRTTKEKLWRISSLLTLIG
jgi:hypothetical protein